MLWNLLSLQHDGCRIGSKCRSAVRFSKDVLVPYDGRLRAILLRKMQVNLVVLLVAVQSHHDGRNVVCIEVRLGEYLLKGVVKLLVVRTVEDLHGSDGTQVATVGGVGEQQIDGTAARKGTFGIMTV